MLLANSRASTSGDERGTPGSPTNNTDWGLAGKFTSTKRGRETLTVAGGPLATAGVAAFQPPKAASRAERTVSAETPPTATMAESAGETEPKKARTSASRRRFTEAR